MGHMQTICISLQRDNHTNSPTPHHSIFYRLDALPGGQPTVSKHWRQGQCYINYTKSQPQASQRMHHLGMHVHTKPCMYRLVEGQPKNIMPPAPSIGGIIFWCVAMQTSTGDMHWNCTVLSFQWNHIRNPVYRENDRLTDTMHQKHNFLQR